MKNLLIFICLVNIRLMFGQVGINTENPKATLQVQGEPTNTDKMDGIIPPKITGKQLRAKTYTSEQDGTIVYVRE